MPVPGHHLLDIGVDGPHHLLELVSRRDEQQAVREDAIQRSLFVNKDHRLDLQPIPRALLLSVRKMLLEGLWRLTEAVGRLLCKPKRLT